MERIGFLGLGTMGAAMAANLSRAGFGVTAWNRTPGPARRSSTQLGTRRADTPAAVAAASDVVVICVSDTPDVEAVLFGPKASRRGRALGHPRHRLLDDRARRDA